MSGQLLKKLRITDYWFDWKTYHPMTRVTTEVFKIGMSDMLWLVGDVQGNLVPQAKHRTNLGSEI